MADDSARAERFLRHLEPLRAALEAYAHKGLADPGAVEDVLQSTVADAFRDFHLYVENTNFRAWIFRYLNLKVLEQNRQIHRLRAEEDLGPVSAASSAEGLGPAEQQRLFQSLAESADVVLEQCDDVIAEAIGELGERERSVLLLRAIGEFKYAEIAAIVEIPVGTVMSSLARTRERLKRRLAEYAGERGFLSGDRQKGKGDQENTR